MIEEKFDNTTEEIYLNFNKIENGTEGSKIKTSKNSDEASENSWPETNKVLVDEISKVLTKASKEELATNIKRTRWVESNSETSAKGPNNSPPNLSQKLPTVNSQKESNQFLL